MTQFSLTPTPHFRRGIARLQDFLHERESASDFPDTTVVERFEAALFRALGILTFAPHTCRRCEQAPEFRELVVPFGQSGYVVLFDIQGEQVLLLAARSQLEEDYR